MGDSKIQMFQDQWFQCGSNMKNKDHSSWMINEGNNSPSSSSIGESTISNASCSSSLETMDDASSPASCTSSSDGALCDLSTLMAQLPIKRGLSEYYEGKSESFTSLASVKSVEDLPKKETPHSRNMKFYKSSYTSYTLPKPIIFKKASRTSFLSSCYNRKSNSSISRSRPPLIPVQRS
ncbi:protein OXIDATIVE STRESS 3-like [Lycium ferocissimum]|uniref:protein OXIDATIVE STRESS 3-like n=1 Tax=Lycium ferocissimum TaxID=112874 RepID=UPI002815C392|nr:protein OXIDATIVE STRESS 3-like [Lycium ferocissimum]